MKKVSLIILSFVAIAVLLLPEPTLAGPGGKIASAAFDSFWGKVVLASLTIVFFPMIVYVLMKEKRAENRTRKDLRYMACYNIAFDWLKIRERIVDCFYRVHSGWENEDLSNTSDWMTDWYWQNQQQVHLDKWKELGLVNICKIKKGLSIKPLLFVHRNQGDEHEGSVLVVRIETNMQDYLEERNTGKIVEGSKKFKDVVTIWSFTFENCQWKVSNIEGDYRSLDYTSETKYLPDIKDTVVSDLRA